MLIHDRTSLSLYAFLQLCLQENERYTVLKESKQSFCSTKNPLHINLKGKLQKPFDFFLRCQTRHIWPAHMLVEIPRGFEL